jgi:hypothetical protein
LNFCYWARSRDPPFQKTENSVPIRQTGEFFLLIFPFSPLVFFFFHQQQRFSSLSSFLFFFQATTTPSKVRFQPQPTFSVFSRSFANLFFPFLYCFRDTNMLYPFSSHHSPVDLLQLLSISSPRSFLLILLSFPQFYERMSADFGLIGLAVMGENLVLNIESRGFTVSVFNRTTSVVDKFLESRGKVRNELLLLTLISLFLLTSSLPFISIGQEDHWDSFSRRISEVTQDPSQDHDDDSCRFSSGSTNHCSPSLLGGR